MPSINRPLEGPVLTFDLGTLVRELRAEDAYRRSGRAGRTLARSGRFRTTLVALAAGAEVGTHQADSPLSLHVLEGTVRFRAAGGEHEAGAGQLLFFAPGDAEDLRASAESAVLLTLSAEGDDHRHD
jgi:quercetin dioxygenase-like cupin family protein